ncbi:MAG: transposase [Nitrospirae bacterium]|nr:transposase [Nitrospirota bacterium]
MAGIRKRHSPHVTVKVVLETIKGQLTTAELTSKYGVHASQITAWKKRALEVLPEAFSPVRKRSDTEQQALIDERYKQIGQLTVECDWLKKTPTRFSG